MTSKFGSPVGVALVDGVMRSTARNVMELDNVKVEVRMNRRVIILDRLLGCLNISWNLSPYISTTYIYSHLFLLVFIALKRSYAFIQNTVLPYGI